MNFNNCSNQRRTPQNFSTSLRLAPQEQKERYGLLTSPQRARVRQQFYGGHAIGCCINSVQNNVSPPAWLDQSHGCPTS